MAHHKPWTDEEKLLLSELWGRKSLAKIAETLQRSENAILIKVHRFGLGAFLESGDYITLNQLLQAVTGSKTSYSYKTTSWIQKRGLPVKMRRVKNDRFRVVYLTDFWKWAEQNRDFLDFSKFEENSLGIEPEWVKAQRKSDCQSGYLCRKTPWTPQEDRLLKDYLKEYRYSYDELSRILHRTCGAIQRRICDLGLKERPIKADNTAKWTEAELALLSSGIRSGQSYELLSVSIGKSSKAIRGKVGATYKTESLDAVRKMMVDPFWGSGAPMPTVNQAKRTAPVKTNLARLAGLLALRRNELGWSPFWQKEMCQHWDDIKGCTANETDCDSCTSFQRIREQYCRRCGATVFSRTQLPDRLCQRCRQQRKTQYFRKMKALAGGRTEVTHDEAV